MATSRLLVDPERREIAVFEDREEPGDWRVEYFDDDGSCFVSVFSGPESEARARGYFDADTLWMAKP